MDKSREINAPPVIEIANRPFSILHRDVWRCIAHAPLQLLFAPAVVCFIWNIVYTLLEIGYPNRNQYNDVTSFIIADMIALSALRTLSQRHRMDDEALRVSLSKSWSYWGLLGVYYRSLWKVGIAVISLFVIISQIGFDGVTRKICSGCFISLCVAFCADQYIRYSFAKPALIFERVNSKEAMQLSVATIQGNRLRLVGYTGAFLLMYAPLVASIGILGPAGKDPSQIIARSLLDLPGLLLLTSLWTTFNALFYIDCRNERLRATFAAAPIGPPHANNLPKELRASRLWMFLVLVVCLACTVWLLLPAPESGHP